LSALLCCLVLLFVSIQTPATSTFTKKPETYYIPSSTNRASKCARFIHHTTMAMAR
jgi:hypothetical protein